MTVTPPMRAGRATHPGLFALILLAHVLAIWLWLHASPVRRSDAASRAVQRVLLRLLPASRARFALPPGPQRPADSGTRFLPARAAPSEAPRSAANSPAAITLPAITADAPSAAAAAPAAVPPLPLDLRLPRAASAPPTAAALARGDPRASTGRRSFGERLGDALGSDDRIVEQDLGGGRRRIRQGANCVEVHEARTAQLEPFSGSTRPVPSVVKACD